jgi:hypothetical protein
MEYRAAPDMDTENTPENKIKIGKPCQALLKG